MRARNIIRNEEKLKELEVKKKEINATKIAWERSSKYRLNYEDKNKDKQGAAKKMMYQ